MSNLSGSNLSGSDSVVSVAQARAGLRGELGAAEWQVIESGFNAEHANDFETLFVVGNGRLGTRGSLEEGHVGERSGTFLSGVYDGYQVPVIDLVNAPDWVSLAVVVNGVRLGVQSCRVVEHERALDFRHGVLWRRTVFAGPDGRQTQLETLRFASFADRRLCALRVEVTPLGHDAEVSVTSALVGHRRNLERLPVYPAGTTFAPEVKWDKWAEAKHLVEVSKAEQADAIYLEMRTIETGVSLGYGSVLQPFREPNRRAVQRGYERIEEQQHFTVVSGQTLKLDKLVSIATSRDQVEDIEASCLENLQSHAEVGFDASLERSREVWEQMWADCDCAIDGDPEGTRAVRFGIYQLLIAANGDDPTVNIGAKSLSGEGYRGHVFWDTEVLMLPFFIYTQPNTARSLLRYRYHTLQAARELARESGARGARYPWESADTGREECPMWTVDGANRFWTRDEEIHVSADVAYGILTYVEATGDTQFLTEFGAEILFETSRFWVDRATYEPETDQYSIKQVMGPDEFHSHVDNNAFTNRMAQWALTQSAQVYVDLSEQQPGALEAIASKIGLNPEEAEQWRNVAAKIVYHLDQDRGVLEQFDGYFDRLDVPITEWDQNNMPRYPEGYHHFNCEDTQLLKQPDVVMLMHVLPDEFSEDVKRANFEYYEARTLHKSSLSPAIHAIMGIEVGDSTRALQYFKRSALVDLTNNQGNTEEGIHIASAGGTWQILVNGFGGFRVRHQQMTFNPWLPAGWQEIRFRLRWRGNSVAVAISQTEATFTLDAADGATETIVVVEEEVTLRANIPVILPLAKPPAPSASSAVSSARAGTPTP
ncbi:MAG TPA: glycosyl hydrolase family 65 protein [Propionibacteriaceae bacterium]|nr:glycosyl hydrolase family 65 protein [Propionibacteriaceae bacterium]